MKKNSFYFLLLCLIAQFFSSCMSNRNADFARRKYFNYKITENSSEKNEIGSMYEITAQEKTEASVYGQGGSIETEFDQLTASLPESDKIKNDISATDAIPSDKKMVNQKGSVKVIKNILARQIQPGSSVLKKQKNPKIQISKPQPSDCLLLEVIIAVLIPPLAVYLHQGEITDFFWIDVILTILFLFPGIVFALLVVLDII